MPLAMGFSPESLYWDSNAGLEIALKEVTNPRGGMHILQWTEKTGGGEMSGKAEGVLNLLLMV